MTRIFIGFGRPATRLADARFNIITKSSKACRLYMRILQSPVAECRVSVAMARLENTPPSRSRVESHNVNPINIRQYGIRGQNFGLSGLFQAENLSQSATVHMVAISGQLDKEIFLFVLVILFLWLGGVLFR
jgi:hypothetical protein